MNTDNIIAYESELKELAESKTNKRFLNDSTEHARIVAKYMIGRSDAQECLIYSGTLGHSLYSEVLPTFAATPQKKIRVLLQQKSIDQVRADFKALIEQHRLEVKVLSDPENIFVNVPHFFTVGDAFRYELDHQATRAISNFHEPETAQKLKDLFERMWKVSQDANQS